MHTTMKHFLRTAAAASLIAVTPVASPAQDSDSNRSRRDGSSQSDSNAQRRSDSNRQANSRRRSGQAGGRSVQVVPQGWVRVGTDYDNDGFYDSVETIYVYDLQQAQQRSQQRKDQARRQNRGNNNNTAGQRSRARDQRQRNRDQRDQGQRDRWTQDWRADNWQESRGESRRESRRDTYISQVAGAIQRIDTGKLAGLDKSYLIANIENQDGKLIRVVLGDKEKFQDWNLQEGDRINVRGVRSRLNDRPIIMADRVRYDGQSKTVELPSRQRLKRARGELSNLRTVRFRGFDQPFLVATLKTPNQKNQTVNLGPKSNLQSLNLQEGDRIRVLARPGKVNGNQAMIAQEIHFQGETVDVPRPDNSRRFRGQNQGRSQNRGGSGNRNQRG